ncbi:unnamed protein product, partial [Nesidiocoris tenuis]
MRVSMIWVLVYDGYSIDNSTVPALSINCSTSNLSTFLRVRYLLAAPISRISIASTTVIELWEASSFFEGVTPGKASITDDPDETLSSSLLDFSSKLRRFSDSAGPTLLKKQQVLTQFLAKLRFSYRWIRLFKPDRL